MSSPTKEELPKIADSLKSELESEHHLKHQQVNEKIVLPTKQGIVIVIVIVIVFSYMK